MLFQFHIGTMLFLGPFSCTIKTICQREKLPRGSGPHKKSAGKLVLLYNSNDNDDNDDEDVDDDGGQIQKLKFPSTRHPGE